MRKTFKTLLLALPLCLAALSAQAADGAAGRWKTIDDKTGKVKSIVEITQAANGTLTGKVVDILHSDKGPNPVCDGCEGANRNKPVKGMTILWNLKADGANKWSVAPSSTRPTARPTSRRWNCSPAAPGWTCPAASPSSAARRPGSASKRPAPASPRDPAPAGSPRCGHAILCGSPRLHPATMTRTALVTTALPYANGPLHWATWSATSRPTSGCVRGE